jgi:cation diffusion facilitator family transporter
VKALKRMALLSIATSLATMALKFGAWYITDSVSLWSDAVESFVNLVAGLTALGALTVAGRPADEDHAYGHEKAEYFASGVEGGLILVAAAAIIWSAAQRLFSPQPLESLGIGLLVSVAAAAMNFTTARIMLRAALRYDSITLEADAKHLMTDVWTSAGIVAGLAVVIFVPRWSILDPIMAIAVGIHIIFTGIDLVRRSANGLMDAALPADEIRTVEEVIRAGLPTDAGFHALRTRKSGRARFIEFHLAVPGGQSVASAHELCDRLESLLEGRLANASVTIHVEPAEAVADRDHDRKRS